MSDSKRTPKWLAEDEEILTTLFDEAGPRPELPPGLRAATEQAWQRKVLELRTRRRQRILSLAAAALVAAAVGLSLWWGSGSGGLRPGELVATVQTATDGLTLDGRSTDAGFEVSAGAWLSVPAGGRAALKLASGASLRLDRGTRIVLASVDRVRLEQGAIYFDSVAGKPDETSFVVDTAFGSVEDVGTQFEVRLLGERLRVRVREGRVDLAREGARHSAGRGEELIVDSSSGVRRGRTDSFGDDWAWAESLAVPFVLDKKTLAELFDWVARETGRELAYGSAEEESAAREIVLHGGSSAGLTPAELLELAIGGTGLAYRFDGERLVVTD